MTMKVARPISPDEKEAIMKRIIALVVGAIFAAAAFSAGCASGGGVGYGLSMKKLGKEKVVEKSGSRPDWAFDKPMYVKNGILYASGFFSDAPNLGKGLEVATKLAQAKMAESIRMRLKDDFTYASEGLDVSSTMLERILNTTTEEIVMRGFFQNKLYYEKKQVMTPGGTAYRYDCFALVEITRDNYMDAVNGGIGANLSGAVSEQFREKVDERQRLFFRLGEKPSSAQVAEAPPESKTEKIVDQKIQSTIPGGDVVESGTIVETTE